MQIRIRFVFGFGFACMLLFEACSGTEGTGPSPPPTATISVSAPASVIAGDTVVVPMIAANATSCTPIVTGNATLLDQNGCISYRIIAGPPGMATVSATASGAGGNASAQPVQISVMPRPSTRDTLTTAVFSPEESDSPPVGMTGWAIWSKNNVKDSLSAPVVNGRMTMEIPVSLDSVRMVFDGDPRYWPRTPVLYHGDYFHQTVSIILEPRNWKIRAQQYAGQVLAVSERLAETAAGPADGGTFNEFVGQFFTPPYLPKSTGGRTKVFVRWPASKLPVRVGIIWSKSPGNDRVADSTYVTDVVVQTLNRALGNQLTVGVIPGDTVPVGMIGITLGNDTLSTPTGGGGTWTDQTTGEILRGSVTFSSRAILGPNNLWAFLHELIHTLGKGHTCSWNTVMISNVELAAGEPCNGKRADSITPMDVAMYEMAIAISDVAKKHNTVFAFN